MTTIGRTLPRTTRGINPLKGMVAHVSYRASIRTPDFLTLSCAREWAALPPPPPPLTVGIDGGYVRHWEDKKTRFEVIVGKSMSEGGPSRCFGFVQTYDPKPKRRLFELLKGQGMQMNQQVMRSIVRGSKRSVRRQASECGIGEVALN